MSRAKIVDHYIEQSLQDRFQIDQVRKELEANNVNGEEISIIVKLVDNDIQKRAVLKTSSKRANQLITAGLILTLAGIVLIAIGVLNGQIFTGGSIYIVYGPLFAGISMLVTGITQKKKIS